MNPQWNTPYKHRTAQINRSSILRQLQTNNTIFIKCKHLNKTLSPHLNPNQLKLAHFFLIIFFYFLEKEKEK